MPVFEKKDVIRGIIGFFFVIASAIGIAADAEAPKGEGVTSVFFIPLQEKSEELIAVELVRPAAYSKFYIGLRQAVQENGWQPSKADSAERMSIMDKCVVSPSANGRYAMECRIFHQDHVDVLQAEAVNTQSVIETIKAFSGLKKNHPSRIFGSRKMLWI